MLLKALLFLVVLAVVAEVWFRFAMPASEVPVSYQDPKSTMSRFDPGAQREGLTTFGRLTLRAGEWQVNDAGWLSPFQYLSAAQRGRPMVALFGDSFVEGFLTDADQHVDAYLHEMLSPVSDAYAFGESGWYLEQYVAVARYVEQAYQPDVLVILLNGGDVTDSIRENGIKADYWWQIGKDGAGAPGAAGTVSGTSAGTSGPTGAAGAAGWKEIAPTSFYSMGTKGKLARESALVRYLRYNAKVELPFMNGVVVAQPAELANAGAPLDGQGAAAGAGTPAGATGTPAPPAPSADQLSAAAYMVERLAADHPGVPIVFASFGERYLSLDELAHIPVSSDAAAVQEACVGRPECHFLDLRYAFSRDWAANHVTFEAVDGGHWNAYANRLVASTLADYIAGNTLLGGSAVAQPAQ